MRLRFALPAFAAVFPFVLGLTCFVAFDGVWQTLALAQTAPRLSWHTTRTSPLDLEIGGDLSGLPPETTRYVSREDLLALPQVNFTVTDDSNFASPAQVRGLELEVLAGEFAAGRGASLIVAVCDDWYRAYYPRTYVQAHRPALALEINGQPPAGWPRASEDSGASMGPYLITHPHFAPAFKILAHEDEAQIPWGVIRLEFRDEKAAFETIAPHGAHAADPAVQAGYRIAQQNCLRCHGPNSEKHLKGKLTWSGIAMFAGQAPKNFTAYVRNPRAIAQYAEMPGSPAYDDVTMLALIAYFKSFSPLEKP